MALNCSHAGHFARRYVAPGRSPHTPFGVLHISPGTNTMWMKTNYTLSLGAQSPWSWASRPSNSGGASTYFRYLDQALEVHCGSSALRHLTHTWFSICALLLPSTPMHLRPCWPLGSPVCLYQYTFVSLGLPLQITGLSPQSVFLPPRHQNMQHSLPLCWAQAWYYPSQGLGKALLHQAPKGKLLRQTPARQPPWLNTLGCYTKA